MGNIVPDTKPGNPIDTKSAKYSVNRADVEQWVENTLIFSSPAILAFLLALQSGSSLHLALAMAEQAFLASSIDFVRKFIAGQNQW